LPKELSAKDESTLTLPPGPYVDVIEGKARVRLLAQSTRVFFNPKMNLSRDFAVLFVSSYFPDWRQLRVCDPMTGSGVRAVRYILETRNVASVVAADIEPETVELARHTVRFNNLEERVSVIESDAHLLLSNYLKTRFDVVDLDPFGSPAPFLESALRTTEDGGVLAATATDMGPLSGARPNACVRKYGVRSIRTEFAKEMAVRILVGCLVGIAARLELGIDVAFSHATDHYARLYAVVKKGTKAANESVRHLGFVAYCTHCLTRSEFQSLKSDRTICDNCKAESQIAGPIWLGPLWDSLTVNSMIEHTPLILSSRLSEMQKALSYIQDELRTPPFYYTTDAVAAAYGTKPSPIASLLSLLERKGYQASKTHFNPRGFRTNARVDEIVDLFRAISCKT
jgi:tRNA (guanine26-N2/guanine27-N2)-dimethyltransferase